MRGANPRPSAFGGVKAIEGKIEAAGTFVLTMTGAGNAPIGSEGNGAEIDPPLGILAAEIGAAIIPRGSSYPHFALLVTWPATSGGGVAIFPFSSRLT
jgi:hypothetical protein